MTKNTIAESVKYLMIFDREYPYNLEFYRKQLQHFSRRNIKLNIEVGPQPDSHTHDDSGAKMSIKHVSNCGLKCMKNGNDSAGSRESVQIAVLNLGHELSCYFATSFYIQG